MVNLLWRKYCDSSIGWSQVARGNVISSSWTCVLEMFRCFFQSSECCDDVSINRTSGQKSLSLSSCEISLFFVVVVFFFTVCTGPFLIGKICKTRRPDSERCRSSCHISLCFLSRSSFDHLTRTPTSSRLSFCLVVYHGGELVVVKSSLRGRLFHFPAGRWRQRVSGSSTEAQKRKRRMAHFKPWQEGVPLHAKTRRGFSAMVKTELS